MKKKFIEWIKRYWLSELVSYTLAIWWWYFIFNITQNYYVSWIFVIVLDTLWYYWVMLIKEIQNTYKNHNIYNYKLLLKDIRNLSFEFWPPQILEFFVTYPLLMFYIPPLFEKYYIWAFVAMIWAVIIFYIQAILLYEIRKIIFK